MRGLSAALLLMSLLTGAPVLASDVDPHEATEGLLQLPIPGTPEFDLLMDGAPEDLVDVEQIPDAVPREEPLSKYGNKTPYEVLGETYEILPTARGFRQTGSASWYGKKFHGQKTSSGEIYDMFKMTAAHRFLPIPTYVRVTRADTGKSIIVKVNDRGPFHSDRIMDLSWAAARKLGIDSMGTAIVSIEALDPAEFQPTLSARGSRETATSPESTARYYVQVAAFSGLESATRLQAQLLGVVYAPVTISKTYDRTPPIHRVQVGPFSSEEDARQVGERIRNAGLGDPIMIKR